MGTFSLHRFTRWTAFALLALLLCGAAAGAAAHLRAWVHYRKAQTALEQYHFAEARNHLAISLRAWPNSGRVHLLAARAARLAQDTVDAEHHLHRCQQLQPANPDVLLEWALLHAANGELALVEGYLREQIRKGGDPTWLIREALIEGYLRTYRIGAALAGVEDWLQHHPDQPQALFLHGCTWQQIQRPQSALASYRRVIELAPERDDARWRLAQCLQKLDLLSEAAFHLDYLHRRYPENREMTVELARNQFKQGQEDDARQLLQTVLHDDPDCISALVERGRIALSASDAAGAETSLRRAIHLNPNDRQALHLLSLTLSRQGSLEEAEKFQDRLKQTERAFQRLAEICLHELGKNPHNPLLHEELGALLLRLGYREAGRNWLLLALEDHPHASRVRALLRSADLESGEKSQPGRYPPRSSEPDTGASS